MVKIKEVMKGIERERVLLFFVVLAIGFTTGLGFFTLQYAEAFSYLTSDPKVCDLCHIMNSEYDSWQSLGHHHSAKCVDCHLPHPFVRKYIGKMQSGFIDAKGFTFQDFEEPIMIKERTKKILQENCLRCHKGIFEFPNRMGITAPKGVDCIHCHFGVAHGQRASIGAPLKKTEESNE